MKLYLFNPENDLAIAFGGINYTPPPAAQLIGQELATLPLWYAHESENFTVLLPGELSQELLDLTAQLGIHPLTTTLQQLDISQVEQINVWGWSLALAKRLEAKGMNPAILPSEEQCQAIRRLSHRSFAAEVGRYLHTCIDYPLPAIPVELHTPDEVRAFTDQPEQRLLKAPWSSSGRGLYWNLYGYDTPLSRWSNGVLQKQGMLMGEPVYNKIDDWAMEFYSDGTIVQFTGYSSFATDNHGAYKGNQLAADRILEAQLAQAVGIEIINKVKTALIKYFTQHVAPFYTGYFGVDMLTYRDYQGEIRLHPFVEINLRMNMGMVARRIADRFIPSDMAGLYRVEFQPQPGTLYQDHLTRLRENPPCIIEGKLHRGYLPLTPVYPHSRYRASVEI